MRVTLSYQLTSGRTHLSMRMRGHCAILTIISLIVTIATLGITVLITIITMTPRVIIIPVVSALITIVVRRRRW